MYICSTFESALARFSVPASVSSSPFLNCSAFESLTLLAKALDTTGVVSEAAISVSHFSTSLSLMILLRSEGFAFFSSTAVIGSVLVDFDFNSGSTISVGVTSGRTFSGLGDVSGFRAVP